MAARRREHLDDYEIAEDGSYVYKGTYRHWSDPQEREAFIKTSSLLLGVAGACLVGAGFVPLGSGATFLMALPYALACICAVMSAVCVARLAREGDPLRERTYQSSVEGLNPRLLGGLVCCFAGAVGALVALAMGGDHAGFKLLFCALMLVSDFSLSRIFHRLSTLSFTSKP